LIRKANVLALPFSFYHKERRNLQQVNQGEKIAQIACRVAASSNKSFNQTANSSLRSLIAAG